MRQDRTQRPPDRDEDEQGAPEPGGQDRRAKLNEDTEATLDEIDDVLEDNAADFVRAYVQKGGQ